MPRTAPGRALPVVQGLLCGIFAAAATPTALLAAAFDHRVVHRGELAG